MQTPAFAENLTKLIELAAAGPTAIMCAEAVPWRCHRSLIADALAARGIEVEHILTATSRKPHTYTPFARVEGDVCDVPGTPSIRVLIDCEEVLFSRNLGFLVLAGIAGLTQAQAPPASQDDVPLYRTDARLVLLHASVVDKNGKLVTNIPQSAFKIFEDGVEQPIRLFRREDVPVSMGIIVDNSGSMTSKRTRVAAAALELVKQSNPDDEVFIVNFNDDTHFDQRLTNDVKKLEAALARMEARGGTAMRDALSKSINYVKKNGKKDKKVLVVITDGNDNSSDITLEQVLRQAHEQRGADLCHRATERRRGAAKRGPPNGR